jgi:hypothetical protein
MVFENEDVLYPPYTPMPSLGRELGIMFGFIGATVFLVVMYFVIWQCKTESLLLFLTDIHSI